MTLSKASLAALAVFVFGCSAFMSASAQVDTCKRCQTRYLSCIQSGVSQGICEDRYVECRRANC